MAPPSAIAPPPPEVTRKEKATSPVAYPVMPVAAPVPVHRPPQMFAEALLDMSTTRPRRRFLDFVLSSMIHMAILIVAVMLPLYFTEAIDMRQFTSTMLVAPPPPPPPPPPAAPAVVRVAPVRRVFTQAGKLMAPTVIPERVAMLKESDIPPDAGVGVVGGVPGGVPGGQMGGVLGGIIGGITGSNLPPPPKAASRAPVRVGGRVREPRPTLTPAPAYPPLARSAKVSGDVVIDAVIDTNGNVVEMKLVSGHPLLITAAMETLKKWKYEPTYLNDEPISVALLVTIRFRLQ